MATKTKKATTIKAKPKFSLVILGVVVFIAVFVGVYLVYQSLAATNDRAKCGKKKYTCSVGVRSYIRDSATYYNWGCHYISESSGGSTATCRLHK